MTICALCTWDGHHSCERTSLMRSIVGLSLILDLYTRNWRAHILPDWPTLASLLS